ncbi:hypothetical protein AJ79_01823 [Helicocarpus griseus UAMH5409]|uniref:Zinc finger PHD-type domain-containing protein n=1 Tax=Helicocarpus griseus UAMH5409 TaxID=1447875 RepID=A0A2B7XWY6_9EURO|nr:hypothetical protein AJ79_01823 [Helicocarpus griseus UAMH5409]
MTPRRSSRARTSQPSAAMQHTNSSSSSNSLSRAERSTRSNNKISSPRRSSTQRSQSIDDLEQNSRPEPPQTRHRQRGRNNGEPDESLQAPNDEYDEEEGDEEEITRCLCGQQDYPGLPLIYQEAASSSTAKAGNVKDDSAPGASGSAEDMQSEEPGSLFIQCDSCKVWQHGGCVGIMEEASSPDEYFCEECRKDLHKIISASNGQKFSRYLPVVGSRSSSSSRSSSLDTARNSKDKKSRSSAEALSTKRRSTMNSRDAAYDEEQLQRAIEESKEDSKSVADEGGSRRGKRSRSDSEANKQASKRQRTGSPSSSLSKQSNSLSHPLSDDESKPNIPPEGNGNKKTRGGARNQREKEPQTSEKEKEPDKETNEPVNRRKSRSDRRKDPDEDPSETISPAKNTSNPPTITQPAPDTPSVTNESSNTKPATRKTGRPPARRGRLGRNQYTRDRDSVNGNDMSGSINSPRRGQSRDTGHGDSPTSGHLGPNGVYLNGGESGKPSKPRYMNPQRTTMNEMKRRVAAILEFISQLQVDMATNPEQTPTNGIGGAASAKEVAEQLANNIDQAMNNADNAEANGSSSQPKEKDFKDLTSIEMMDVLTRDLVKWQQEFGKYGEK